MTVVVVVVVVVMVVVAAEKCSWESVAIVGVFAGQLPPGSAGSFLGSTAESFPEHASLSTRTLVAESAGTMADVAAGSTAPA